MKKIYLYDTTLRDGGQTSFVDFTLENKLDIAAKLDDFGVDFIEAGWPGANPTDSGFFADIPKCQNSKITAFGMTSRRGVLPREDKAFLNLLDSDAEIITIVGKGWDFQVVEALGISLEDNLKIVEDSIIEIIKSGKRAFFDAEHFFDGFKDNKEYSLKVIRVAISSGAEWVILCDTNGGTLPNEVFEIVSEVTKEIDGSKIGIHCHNDTGNAVANSLEAVRAGARQIQGTINGLGERCGNANLTSLIPVLKLKLNYDVAISDEKLKEIKHLSNYLCDLLNYPYDAYAPFVGCSAFAHKGGLHASGVAKNSKCYEHIEPSLVGNSRNILVSNQAGKASVISRLNELNIKVKESKLSELLELVKVKEEEGFSYDLADSSFAILANNLFNDIEGYTRFYELETYRIVNDKRVNEKGEVVTFSEATVKLYVRGKREIIVAEGNGPVAALNNALMSILEKYYPILKKISLSDYKVRILNSDGGANALIRVLIETTDHQGNRWVSVGADTDIINASYMALRDAIYYILLFLE